MSITIEIRTVYGQKKAYPACDTAQKFAKLIGCKTFSHAALCHIESLGYSIISVADVSREGLS